MKFTFKRTLALVLALVMVLGMMPTFAMAAEVDANPSHVYTVTADAFTNLGKWTVITDETANNQTAIQLNIAGIEPFGSRWIQTFANGKAPLIGAGGTDVQLGKYDATAVQANATAEAGYVLYKFEDITTTADSIMLWDRDNIDGPLAGIPTALVGKTFDLYVSLKATGTITSYDPASTACPNFYIDYVTFVEKCTVEDWNEVPATCSSNAGFSGVCTVCGDTVVEETPDTKLPHSFVSYDWTETGYVANCSVCGEPRVPATGMIEGELPSEIALAGIGLEHVYDIPFGSANATLAGTTWATDNWSSVEDAAAIGGKAATNKWPINSALAFIMKDDVGTVGSVTNAQVIKDGNYHAYLLAEDYVYPNVNLTGSIGNSYGSLYLTAAQKILKDKTVDLWVSLKTDAEGHPFYDRLIAVEACADENCNCLPATYVAPHVHEYTSEVTAPTCVADGFTTFTCTGCGASYTEAGEAADGVSHTFGEYELVDGMMTATCTGCGAEDSYAPLPEEITADPAHITDIDINNAFAKGNWTVENGVASFDLGAGIKAAEEAKEGAGWTFYLNNAPHANNTKWVGDASVNATSKAFWSRDELNANSGLGYKLYQFEDLVLGSYLYLYDNNGGDGPAYAVPSALKGKTADVWVSMSVTGTVTPAGAGAQNTTTAAFSINRVIIVTDCENYGVAGEVVAPGCETAGYTPYTCSVCSATYTADATEATGHTFGEYELVDGKLVAECVNGCGTTDEQESSISAPLPEGVEADLRHVYDYTVADFGGTWTKTEDAVTKDFNGISWNAFCNTVPYANNVIFLSNSTSINKDSAQGWWDPAVLNANSGAGYQIYKFENVQMANNHINWFGLWENPNSDGPLVTYDAALKGKTVDVYVSLKIDGTFAGTANYAETTAVVSINRVIFVERCENYGVAGEVVAPGCETAGYTPYTCSVCAATYEADATEATGHSFTDYVLSEGKLVAECDNGCGTTDEKESDISAPLPEGVEADLRHVYDYTVADFGGTWTKTEDAVSKDFSGLSWSNYLNNVPYANNVIFLSNSTAIDKTSAQGWWDPAVLNANDGAGYQIYKFENVQLADNHINWFGLWENANSDGPTVTYDAALKGKTVDVYVSLKIDGTFQGTANWEATNAVVSINRVIFVERCENYGVAGEVTAPTCEAAGYTTYTCSVCAATYEADATEATGHTFGEYELVDGKLVAECVNGCGATDEKESSVSGELPEEITADLRHVTDLDMTAPFVSGAWTLTDGVFTFDLGATVNGNWNAYLANAPYNNTAKWVGDASVNATSKAYWNVDQLNANSGAGYKFYQFEDLTLGTYLYLYDNNNGDGPCYTVPAALKGKTADVWVSMSVTGTVAGTGNYAETTAVFSINRVIIVTDCENYGVEIEKVEGDCSNPTTTTYKCSVCDAEYTVTEEATGHAYGNYVKTADGYAATCANCGGTKSPAGVTERLPGEFVAKLTEGGIGLDHVYDATVGKDMIRNGFWNPVEDATAPSGQAFKIVAQDYYDVTVDEATGEETKTYKDSSLMSKGALTLSGNSTGVIATVENIEMDGQYHLYYLGNFTKGGNSFLKISTGNNANTWLATWAVAKAADWQAVDYYINMKAVANEDGTETYWVERLIAVKAHKADDGCTMYVPGTYTVTFSAGEGSGEMEAATATDDAAFVLPECTFTAPVGSAFAGWSVNGVDYQPGDSIDVLADTVVTATWNVPTAIIGNKGYATLEAAFAAVEDGETIEIMAGTYNWLHLSDADRVYADITVKAFEGADVTINGIRATSGLENVTFENLTIHGEGTQSFIAINYFDGLTFSGCTFTGNRHAIHAYTSDTNNAAGVEFYNLTINDCVFDMTIDETDGQKTSIMFLRPLQGLTITNSTFKNAEWNAVQLTGCKEDGVAIPNSGDITITGNTFENIGSINLNLYDVRDDYEGTVTISGNTFADPNHPDHLANPDVGQYVYFNITEKSFEIADDNTGDETDDFYYHIGAVEQGPVVGDPLTIAKTGKSAMYEDIVQLKYLFQNVSGCDADVILNNGKVLVWSGADVNDEATYELGTETYSVSLTKNGNIYQGVGEGIAAKDMGDDQMFRLCVVDNDGVIHYGNVETYSLVTYAVNMYGKSTTAQAEKDLLVALMNYGAAAQIYFGYKADALMNTWLPADLQNVYDTYTATALKEDTAGKFAFETTAIYDRLGKSAVYVGAIELKVLTQMKSDYTGGSIKLVYWNEAAYNAADTLTVENATGVKDMILNGAFYEGFITGTPAKQLGDTCYFCVMVEKDGATYYGELQTYSLHTYASNQIGKTTVKEPERNLCKAMLVYSNAAEAKFS